MFKFHLILIKPFDRYRADGQTDRINIIITTHKSLLIILIILKPYILKLINYYFKLLNSR